MKKTAVLTGLAIIIWALWILLPAISYARQALPCLDRITSTDALLIADHDGQILYKKNEGLRCIPASTLKVLTALTAIHHLSCSYRFQTQFYMDPDQNLKIKGYGDPLLISEVWQEIAGVLSQKMKYFKDLVLDGSYFSQDIEIPWVGESTNPYDAPVGALCANFNTVFFDRDQQGEIISAEPQTPMIPFAQDKIRSLGLERGRYTFTHDRRDAAYYAGNLLLHFLRERGVESRGKIRLGTLEPKDTLIHTYFSRFTLDQALKKMMEFSNNFMANQIFITLGAHVYGPPGTLAKGAKVVSEYAKKELGLKDINIVEGSGISRENRISAMEMLTVLKRFRPYRHLLNKKGQVLSKTGSLQGVRTRVGYLERSDQELYYFVIFLNRAGSDIEAVMECVMRAPADRGSKL